MTAADAPIYEPGDVVSGDEPYKGDEAARPWLVIANHEGRPFHGEQYIALSLTTRTWMDGLIEIDPDEWIHGGGGVRCPMVMHASWQRVGAQQYPMSPLVLEGATYHGMIATEHAVYMTAGADPMTIVVPTGEQTC